MLLAHVAVSQAINQQLDGSLSGMQQNAQSLAFDLVDRCLFHQSLSNDSNQVVNDLVQFLALGNDIFMCDHLLWISVVRGIGSGSAIEPTSFLPHEIHFCQPAA